MKIIDAPQYGPSFRFTDASVYWALYILSDGRRVGRKRLAELTGIGEGSMRRILNTLKERGFIDIKQTGIVLTNAGHEFIKSIPMDVLDLEVGDLVLGDFTQAVKVKGVASKINNGLQQRDAGIRVGALGCTTLLLKNGELILPPDWSIDENKPELAAKIKEIGKLTSEDVIIIGSGNDKEVAITAAITAAFEII